MPEIHFYYRCSKCHENREGDINEPALIRGLCKKCAPELFTRRNDDMALMREMSDAFKAKTGKDSLEDWSGFERFMETYASDKRMVVFAEHAAEYDALKQGVNNGQ